MLLWLIDKYYDWEPFLFILGAAVGTALVVVLAGSLLDAVDGGVRASWEIILALAATYFIKKNCSLILGSATDKSQEDKTTEIIIGIIFIIGTSVFLSWHSWGWFSELIKKAFHS